MGQCILILAIALAGQYISNLISFPIPKTIVSAFILFFLLELKIVKLDYLKGCLGIFKKNLAFLFLPVGVGIMTQLDSYSLGEFGKIFAIVIGATFIVMFSTGKLADFILSVQDKLRNGKGE